MERRSDTNDTARTAALTALALIGPLFGIATQVWGQALLLLGLAILLIVAPPRRSPGPVLCILFAALAVIALTAFLPVRWFAIPEWRKTLVGEHRVELPQTLSPQPWVSLHAACLLFAGAAFAFYAVTHPWSPQLRRQAARWYTGGIACIAAVAIAVLMLGWKVPFWPKVLNSADYFGVFPNRNQTANLFALAGIMATALAFDGFEKGRRTALLWTGSVVLLGAGTVQTYSRAGCLIFFTGIAAYGLLSFFLSTSAKGGALTLAGFALLLTGFFIFGGGTFERFQRLATDASPDYRVLIQRDALHLAATAPWLGQGLGNFAPVFAMAREASSTVQNRVIHPESDWLWVAVEMGWPAALILLGACGMWLRQSLPLSLGSDRALRSAALVCGLVFLAHSFVDVSGHRPGTAWPALFLSALALHPKRSIVRRAWVAPAFRGLGLVLAIIACWWFASVFSERVGRRAPTMATAMMLEERTFQQTEGSLHEAAVASASGALRIMPLNADMYFQRGIAHLVEAFSIWGTTRDFAIARFLEPRWAALCYAQGKAWAEAGQAELAFEAWVEGLRRAGKNGPTLYHEMLLWSGNRPAMQAMLARLARNDPDYFLVYLRHASREESDLLISQLVQAEPDLKSFSAGQRNALFAMWFRQGDHSSLFTALLSNPEWQQEGWRWVALLHAEKKEFQRACELMRNSIPPPPMPKVAGAKPILDLERMLRARPDDIDIGLQLRSAQIAAGKTAEAIETLRALQALPNHPAYLAFIEAEQLEQTEDWEGAWRAWQRFAGSELQ